MGNDPKRPKTDPATDPRFSGGQGAGGVRNQIAVESSGIFDQERISILRG
jgi:hypothetical protein